MKFLKLLAVLALAAGALFAGMQFSARQTSPLPAPAPEAGGAEALQKLLNLKLRDPQGREVSLSQWQGKILVVNFWATWCPPCKEEMPAFSRLHQEWQGRGVQFVGIAADSAENVKRFAEKTPVSYPLLLGGNDITRLTQPLGNHALGLPFTLIIRADGQLHAQKLGTLQESELAALLSAAATAPAKKQNH